MYLHELNVIGWGGKQHTEKIQIAFFGRLNAYSLVLKWLILSVQKGTKTKFINNYGSDLTYMYMCNRRGLKLFPLDHRYHHMQMGLNVINILLTKKNVFEYIKFVFWN